MSYITMSSTPQLRRLLRIFAQYLAFSFYPTHIPSASYENVNVEPERTPLNISFKSAGDMTYNEYFDSRLAEGKISVRGLKADVTHFNEMIIDVNTEYFEEHGGYEFDKRFHEEAYRFCCDFYSEECIVSAVMHADEINREVTDRLGRSVYHYHLRVVAIPTVDKEIRWLARCKDESLRGKVKAVVRQVSHSKKWISNVPMTDENGNPVINASGKPVFVKSYSVLQDRLFEHMRAAGFTGFERGVRGSTVEHLTSLQYQIAKDMESLNAIDRKVADTKERLAQVEVEYSEQAEIHKSYSEIDEAGKKSLGRYVMSKEDYRDLTALAKRVLHPVAKSVLCKEMSAMLRSKTGVCVHSFVSWKRGTQKWIESIVLCSTGTTHWQRPAHRSLKQWKSAVRRSWSSILGYYPRRREETPTAA